ncbi:unnamed protein product [Pneumocystis jirovecii]|uniref:PH domain-containing protein n=1 Tax=Pneumocystis jirovecii TaxID=42068 RepID=L0PC45_PNEJI|nr:unnamed protein product [Pneumocystis jirovecii]
MTKWGGNGAVSPVKQALSMRRRPTKLSARTHNLEFAAEIGQGLLAEVRRLQGVLGERDTQWKAAEHEKRVLEQQIEALEHRLKAVGESEERYKEENWNLELQTQDLNQRVNEVSAAEQRVTQENVRLQRQTQAQMETVETLRARETELSEEVEQLRTRWEIDSAGFRRTQAELLEERAELMHQIEELKAELEAQRQPVHWQEEWAGGNDMTEVQTAEELSDDATLEEQRSPQSPIKHTPLRSVPLEVETMKASFSHAQRTIYGLRNAVQHEKSEKIKLRQRLNEALEQLEKVNAKDQLLVKRKVPRRRRLFHYQGNEYGSVKGRNGAAIESDLEWEYDQEALDQAEDRPDEGQVFGEGSLDELNGQNGHIGSNGQNGESFEAAFEPTFEPAFGMGYKAGFGTDSGIEESEEEKDLRDWEDKRLSRMKKMDYMDDESDAFLNSNNDPDKYKEREVTVEKGRVLSLDMTGQCQPLFKELQIFNQNAYVETVDVATMTDEVSDLVQIKIFLFNRDSSVVERHVLSGHDKNDFQVQDIKSPSRSPSRSPVRSPVNQLDPARLDKDNLSKDHFSIDNLDIEYLDPDCFDKNDVDMGHITIHPSGRCLDPERDLVYLVADCDTVDLDGDHTADHLDTACLGSNQIIPDKCDATLHDTVYLESKHSNTDLMVEPSQNVKEDDVQDSNNVESQSRPFSFSSIVSIFKLGRKKSIHISPSVSKMNKTPSSDASNEETSPVNRFNSLEVMPDLELMNGIKEPQDELSSKLMSDAKCTDNELDFRSVNGIKHENQSSDSKSMDNIKQEDKSDSNLINNIKQEDKSTSKLTNIIKRLENEFNMTYHSRQSKAAMERSQNSVVSSKMTFSDQGTIFSVSSKFSENNTTDHSLHSCSLNRSVGSRILRKLNTNSTPRLAQNVNEEQPFHHSGFNAQDKSVGSSPCNSFLKRSNTFFSTPTNNRRVLSRSNTAFDSARATKGSIIDTDRKMSYDSFSSSMSNIENFQPQSNGLKILTYTQSSIDPQIIHSVTQTMIGEYLWKYTRKHIRQELSRNRHLRFFWIHPYSRSLYWSKYNPSTSYGHELYAKSAFIQSVKVVYDNNPYPQGIYNKSIIVVTPTRAIKFTTTSSSSHELWYQALLYLTSRVNLLMEIPTNRAKDVMGMKAFDLTSQQANENISPTFKHSRDSSSTFFNNSNMATLEKKSSLRRQSSFSRLNQTIRSDVSSSPSLEFKKPYPKNYASSETERRINDRYERINSIIKYANLENVRSCCDGKHDVSTLPHRSKSFSSDSRHSRSS